MKQLMRGRVERFVVLPFSVGCVSQSSVAVCDNQPKKAQMNSNPSQKGLLLREEGGSLRAGEGLLLLPRPSVSAALQRLMKGFKGLSQLFSALHREEDEEMEMEIGFPTDVKHVAHIGWDDAGAGGAPAMKGWDRGPELLALPSIPLGQFELAMAAQADPPPLATTRPS